MYCDFWFFFFLQCWLRYIIWYLYGLFFLLAYCLKTKVSFWENNALKLFQVLHFAKLENLLSLRKFVVLIKLRRFQKLRRIILIMLILFSKKHPVSLRESQDKLIYHFGVRQFVLLRFFIKNIQNLAFIVQIFS